LERKNGEGILSKLPEDERTLLKEGFSKAHMSRMNQQYATGVNNLSETEKCCFEFMHSLNFENNFYSIDG